MSEYEGLLPPDEGPSDEEIARLEPTSDEYEAAVRKKWGYTASETRTEAERHQAAARMLEKAGGALRNVAEPGDDGDVDSGRDAGWSASRLSAPSEFRPDPKPERKR